MRWLAGLTLLALISQSHATRCEDDLEMFLCPGGVAAGVTAGTCTSDATPAAGTAYTPSGAVCDGIADCSGGEDEMFCASTMFVKDFVAGEFYIPVSTLSDYTTINDANTAVMSIDGDYTVYYVGPSDETFTFDCSYSNIGLCVVTVHVLCTQTDCTHTDPRFLGRVDVRVNIGLAYDGSNPENAWATQPSAYAYFYPYEVNPIESFVPTSALAIANAGTINGGYHYRFGTGIGIQRFDAFSNGNSQFAKSVSVWFDVTPTRIIGIRQSLTDTDGTTTSIIEAGVFIGDPSVFTWTDMEVTVTVYYTEADNTGYACGIQIATAALTDPRVGCDTNPKVWTFGAAAAAADTGVEGFAAFAAAIGKAAGSGDQYLYIYPMSYVILQPTVYSWVPTDVGVTAQLFGWIGDAGTDQTVTWHSRDVRQEDAIIWQTHGPDSTATPTTVQRSVSLSGIAACVPVFLEYSIVIANRVMKAPNHFTAGAANTYDYNGYLMWTSGWVASTSPISVVTLTGGGTPVTQSTQAAYYLPLDSTAVCDAPFDGPFEFMINQGPVSSFGLYVNGIWIGNSGGRTIEAAKNGDYGTDYVEITEMITSVRIFYLNTTDAVSGIKFTTQSGSEFDLGVVTGDNLLSLPKGGIHSHIEYQVTAGGFTLQLYSARPSGPVLPNILMVPDIDPDNPLAADFSARFDADLLRLVFCNPATITSIEFYITGKFLGGDNTGSMTATAQPLSMAAGGDSGIILHHLIAGQEYQISASSWFDFGGQISMTPVSDLGTFTVPTGIIVDCTADGIFSQNIEYEDLPEPRVKVCPQTGATFNSTLAVTDYGVESSYQDIFGDNSIYVKYDSGSFPPYPPFAGFPSKFGVYWDDSTPDGSAVLINPCIRGAWISYIVGLDQTETTFWLSGSAADKAGYTGEAELDLTGRTISAVYANTNTDFDSCVDGIDFSHDFDSLGPGTVDTTGSGTIAQPTPDAGDPTLYLYGLTIWSNADGRYIYGMSGDYASVDFPNIVPLDTTPSGCGTLARVLRWQFIRNSYWYEDYTISGNNQECGTIQQILNSNDGENHIDDDQTSKDTRAWNHEVVYHQKFIRERDAGVSTLTANGVTITRRNAWEVDSFCYYDADGQVSSTFETKEEEAYKQTSYNNLNFRIRLFKSDKYDIAYDDGSSPTIVIGEPVYVQVELENPLENFVVVATNCWANRNAISTTMTGSYWPLMTDTCASDDTLVRSIPATKMPYQDDFQFNAFAWVEGEAAVADIIYLTCDVRACPNTGTDYCAVTATDDCGKKRARRDTEAVSSVAKRWTGPHDLMTSQTITRAHPVIVVSKRHAEKPEVRIVGDKSVSFTGGLSFFIAGMSFLVLAIGYRLYRARRTSIRYATHADLEA